MVLNERGGGMLLKVDFPWVSYEIMLDIRYK